MSTGKAAKLKNPTTKPVHSGGRHGPACAALVSFYHPRLGTPTRALADVGAHERKLQASGVATIHNPYNRGASEICPDGVDVRRPMKAAATSPSSWTILIIPAPNSAVARVRQAVPRCNGMERTMRCQLKRASEATMLRATITSLPCRSTSGGIDA
jgi:hypothetical protein